MSHTADAVTHSNTAYAVTHSNTAYDAVTTSHTAVYLTPDIIYHHNKDFYVDKNGCRV